MNKEIHNKSNQSEVLFPLDIINEALHISLECNFLYYIVKYKLY